MLFTSSWHADRGKGADDRGPYNRAGDRGPDKSNSLFTTLTTAWSREKFFFYLVTASTTPWSREKTFFHFSATFATPWLQEKENDFIAPLSFTTIYLRYANIFLHPTGQIYVRGIREHSHDIFPEYSENVPYEIPGNIPKIMLREYWI